MTKKQFSFLLISAVLLFSFSSLLADVTVTYQDASFPYNTTGNTIIVEVNTTDDIAAFDLVAKVRSTVTNAFGTVTAVNLIGAANPGSDIVTGVDGLTDDLIRMWGFDCATPIQLSPGIYNFEITVTTNCEIGEFVVENGGDWIVDIDPVVAISQFVTTGAVAANLTVNTGTYTVFNTAPTVTNCPTTAWVYNACDIVTYTFTYDDVDNTCLTDPTWSIVPGGSAGGSIDANSGAFLWDPPAVDGICGLYDMTVRITDEWLAYTDCYVEISLITDAPIFTECPTPGSELFIYWGWTADGSVDAYDPDDCPLTLEYSLVSFSGPGTFDVNDLNGDWTWPTVFGDDAYLGDHTVQISVYDGCETDLCTFVIHVAPTFEVYIEKTHGTLQGHIEMVDIYLDHWTEGMGGFDFLIAYDASALSPFGAGAVPGTILETCGFEYFNTSFGAQSNCTGSCPDGLLRIVSIADYNNGANHPACYGEGLTGSLVTLKFYVTNNRLFECQYVPIQFYWLDCGDNGISSISGDTLYIANSVTGFDLVGDITGTPGYGGWQGTGYDCLEGDKLYPDTVINFFNGGIDIVCKDSIDDIGDINMNGIDNEIADAVLFTNYFLEGIIVFDIALEGQIAASDVNADGTPLTVGDLVYLIRIITGDALPFAKLAPFSASADVNIVNDKISVVSSVDIGGLYMTFKTDGDYEITNHVNMEVLTGEHDGLLHVLVYSGLGDSELQRAIIAGDNDILSITGAELNSVEISDYSGTLMETRVEKSALPTQFSLRQNVPNPFNPTTKIGFDLPVVTTWALDIYNVNGQLITSYNGTSIGHVDVNWDASNVASGIYFYRLTADNFSATKKMVLMK